MFCNVVYLGRTPYNEDTTIETFHRWSGMSDVSSNWKFSRSDLKKSVPDNWSVIDIGNMDVVLKRNSG